MLPKDLLASQAKRKQDQIALVDKGLSFSYQELYQKALQLVGVLQTVVHSPEYPVVLLFDPSIEGIIAAYACLILNLVFVPLSPRDAVNNITSVLDQVKPEILLTLSESLENLDLPNTAIVAVDKLQPAEEDQSISEIEADIGNDTAAIIFTSGSSGQAKGVLIPHAAWEEMVNTWEQELRISQYDQYLVMSGFNFCGFFDDMFMCFFVGGTMHICDEPIKRNIKELVEYIQEHQITFIDFTPAYARQLNRFLDRNPEQTLPDNSMLIVGSESWFIRDMVNLQQALPSTKVISSYGLTEAVVDSGIFQANEIEKTNLAPDEIVPIGRPFGNTNFIIVDENNKPVEPGEEGELYIASAGLASGYYGQYSSNNFGTFGDKRVVRTGDLAVQDETGLTRLTGRKDQVIKIHGKRVDLKQIEQIVFEISGVDDAAILSQNNAGITSVLCFISVSEKDHESEDTIVANVVAQAKLVTQLDSLPLQVIFVPQIPRKSDGKTNFAALRTLVEKVEEHESTVSDQFDSIRQVFRYFIGENFNDSGDIFMLGADSLMIEEIALEVETQLGTVIPTNVFYQERTFEKIVAYLESQKVVEEFSLATVRSIESDARLPVDFPRPTSETLKVTEANLRDNSPVLLTGATGFLGIHLLHELTSQLVEVKCLVRGDSKQEALQRIRDNWAKYISTPFPAKQISVINGDFSQPNLGLPDEQFASLAGEVGGVIHAGYWINFLLNYESLRDTNVQGLENLLRFAALTNVKPFAFISSSSASLIEPSDQLSTHDGYELTKYVNEITMSSYGALGYPQSVFAPALITPSLECPHFSQHDFFWSFVQSSISVSALPDIDWTVDLVPVDFLAQIICSNRDFSGKKTIISNREMLSIDSMATVIKTTLGQEIKIVPFDDWKALIRQRSLTDPSLPLRPFLSGLEQKGVSFFDSGSKDFPENSIIVSGELTSSQLFANYLLNAK